MRVAFYLFIYLFKSGSDPFVRVLILFALHVWFRIANYSPDKGKQILYILLRYSSNLLQILLE